MPISKSREKVHVMVGGRSTDGDFEDFVAEFSRP